MRLEEGINLRWLVYLCFRLLGGLVVCQYGKFHYTAMNQCNARQSRNGTRLTFLAPQGGTVHGPAHHPQNESDGFVNTNVVFILLFEKALGGSIVRADTGCFPPGIVARGIGMVQLEAIVWVISSIEEGDAKGSET